MRLFATVLLAGIVTVSGCGGKGVKPTSQLPLSREAQEVESTSTSESLIRAAGRGTDVQSAIHDAKKAAIWYLLYSGSGKPLLKSKDERQNFAFQEQQFFKNISSYIRHTSDLKSKRKMADETIVEVVVRVDRMMLIQYLEDQAVITSMDDLADVTGLPFISVVTTDQTIGIDLAKGVIGEYLTDRDFKVTVVDQSGIINHKINKISQISGTVDPAHTWALESGSDIHIDIKIKQETGRVSGVSTK